MAHSSQKVSVFQGGKSASAALPKTNLKEDCATMAGILRPRTNRNCQPNGVESSLDLPKQLESFSTHGTTIPVNPCFPQSLPKSSEAALLEDATTTKAMAPSEWPAPSSRPHVEPSESTAARNPGSTRPQSSHDLPGMRCFNGPRWYHWPLTLSIFFMFQARSHHNQPTQGAEEKDHSSQPESPLRKALRDTDSPQKAWFNSGSVWICSFWGRMLGALLYFRGMACKMAL